jgi:putative tryptophan/tyrosine transport system substrate-binding protein
MIPRILAAFVAVSSIAVGHAASAAESSSLARVPRIAILANIPPTTPDAAAVWTEFERALEQDGYIVGKTIEIDRRYVEGRTEYVSLLAADIVRTKPDVIVVTAGGAATRAAKDAAPTTPIVMVEVGDPVSIGLVASLAHSGGNVTGIAALQVDLIPKRLELLKTAIPKASRVAVLLPSRDAFGATWLPAAVQERAAAAKAMDLDLISIEIRSTKEFSDIAAAIIRAQPDAILVGAHPITNALAPEIAEFALKHRIPTFACCRLLSRAGVLISYGPSLTDEIRSAAIYVNKILKGAKPADLPVEQPTRFELIVNMKTADAIGVTIPQPILLRADELLQ